MSAADLRAARTHCPHGHEFTPENTTVTIVKTPGRVRPHWKCRTCNRKYKAKRRASRRADAA